MSDKLIRQNRYVNRSFGNGCKHALLLNADLPGPSDYSPVGLRPVTFNYSYLLKRDTLTDQSALNSSRFSKHNKSPKDSMISSKLEDYLQPPFCSGRA